MLYDIEAIQYLYGPNNNYRTGNDVYVYSPTGIVYEAIWDAGGVDEISAELFSTPVVINLKAGDYNTAIGPTDLSQFNIAIASRAVIENAKGGAGSDKLTGNQVANRLEGNAGNDTLDGGTAASEGTGTIPKGQGDGVADTLIGGANDDAYVLRFGGVGVDEITDSEGNNRLEFRDGQDLPVAAALWGLRDAPGVDSWTNPLTNATFSLSGGVLTGNVPIEFAPGQTVTVTFNINGYQPASYQLLLLDPSVVPETTNTINLADQPDDPGTSDTPANDLILGDARDNSIASFAGNDWIQAGAGRDWVFSGATNVGDFQVIEGGAGDDALTAGPYNDQLYADARVDLAQAIIAGATPGNGLHGDWLSGGWGDDILVGDLSNDGFSAGPGKDIVVAGGGDDNILGDADWVPTTVDWYYVDNPVTGIREFYWFNSTGWGEGGAYAVGDADIIYGGAGADIVWGGGGDDLVYGEQGQDQLVGDAGADVLRQQEDGIQALAQRLGEAGAKVSASRARLECDRADRSVIVRGITRQFILEI